MSHPDQTKLFSKHLAYRIDLACSTKAFRIPAYRLSDNMSTQLDPAQHEAMARRNMGEVPPEKPNSVIRTALDRDNATRLRTLLELVDVVNDADSLTGRVLHANEGRGIHLLMNECIKRSAPRCLKFLMEWTTEPNVPFTYELDWVYERAKEIANIDGAITCLLMLHDEKICLAEDGLFESLLSQARTHLAVKELVSRLPIAVNLIPALTTQCEAATVQPLVIESFLRKIPPSDLFFPPAPLDGITLTPLSTAAHALHVPALTVFFREGVPALKHLLSSPIAGVHLWPTHNPLVAAMSQALPRPPCEPTPLPDLPFTPSHKTIPVPPKSWTTGLARLASLMRSTAITLLNQAILELFFPNHSHSKTSQVTAECINLYTATLDRAALVFLHAVRTFLLDNLRWMISSSSKKRKALKRDVEGRRSAWGGYVLYGVGCVWRDGRMKGQEGEREEDGEGGRKGGYWCKEGNRAGWMSIAEGEQEWGEEAKREGEVKLPGSVLSYVEAGEYAEWLLPVSWRSGMTGRRLIRVLEGVVNEGLLPGDVLDDLEDTWDMLARPEVLEVAGEYLDFTMPPGREGKEWNGREWFWDLLVAGEKKVPRSWRASSSTASAASTGGDLDVDVGEVLERGG